MKQVLFDTDVIIDVLSQRQPFFLASSQALSMIKKNGDISGYLAAHTVTNLFYILRRQLGKDTTLKSLKLLLQNLHITTLDEQIIKAALQSSMSDFEDAVTSEAAHAANIDVIVTRNVRDYTDSSVQALAPTEFLAQFSV
ncbi:MAG: PIN domain-containing protein [Spirulinaceae cyanobacterium]